jgi:hypothetical protein
MAEIQPQSIVDIILSTQSMKLKLQSQLIEKKELLQDLELYKEIKDLEQSIQELEKQENNAKEQGKQIMLSN